MLLSDIPPEAVNSPDWYKALALVFSVTTIGALAALIRTVWKQKTASKIAERDADVRHEREKQEISDAAEDAQQERENVVIKQLRTQLNAMTRRVEELEKNDRNQGRELTACKEDRARIRAILDWFIVNLPPDKQEELKRVMNLSADGGSKT